MKSLPENLAALLLPWYEAHHRQLPWRESCEPYHVWLSEVMLQQTRVEAVKGYYARFLRELPTIEALAACEPDRLNKLWEGLGYYSRARNLQKAAKIIMEQHGGAFPDSYEKIRALPGIGDYTAGAIGSICFALPTPAVDGNVLRVLSRVMEDGAPITDQRTKKDYARALQPLYDKGNCGALTQALMELGATICAPNGAPQCESCPLAELCLARAHDTWKAYPVKAEKKARKAEEKTVFHLTCEDALAVRRRESKGLLAGLWELPNVPGTLDAAQALSFVEALGCEPVELQKQIERTHIFTHITWHMRCYYIVCGKKAPGLLWADAARRAADVALPTAFRMFTEAEEK